MVIQIVFEDSQLVEMASKHLANFAKNRDIPKKNARLDDDNNK